jgi:hypothetical protein
MSLAAHFFVNFSSVSQIDLHHLQVIASRLAASIALTVALMLILALIILIVVTVVCVVVMLVVIVVVVVRIVATAVDVDVPAGGSSTIPSIRLLPVARRSIFMLL